MVITLFGIGLSLIKSMSMTKEQAAMEQYLEEKYGQEFNVEKPKYEGGGFGVDGTWEATASPVTDKTLIFRVGATKNLDYFSDQYVAAIWSREQAEKAQPAIKAIYGDNSGTKVTVRVIFSGDLEKEATLTSPSYEDAKRDYAERGFYYMYTIHTSSGNDISTEAKKVYELIELARKDGIKKVGVRYIERKDGDELVSNLGASKTDSITDASQVEEYLGKKVKMEE